MKIAHAPPAHRGVTMIMGVGAADVAACPPYQDAIKGAGMASAAVWALGVLTGSKHLRHVGFGGALASLGAHMLARSDR